MHLLNVDTLKLESFLDAEVPAYAILSHTWGKEEVTFTDIQEPASSRMTSLAGFVKIQKTCEQAKLDKYQYVWIDTCCIDKRSSAELSEAINSMIYWYRDAGVCYAYLPDVAKSDIDLTFPKSRWFTRGWTLQELLAPDDVLFYDRDWHSLGTRNEHARWISTITAIDLDILRHPRNRRRNRGDIQDALAEHSIAKRMSWASNRTTSRVEDIAYCLLGIFNVNMPLLYGERERAFIRLQEELIKISNDNTILAWALDTRTWDPGVPVPGAAGYHAGLNERRTSILASSPNAFKDCRDVERHIAIMANTKPFTMTNAGLEIELPLIPIDPPRHSSRTASDPDDIIEWIGLLDCSTEGASKFVGIMLALRTPPGHEPVVMCRVPYQSPSSDDFYTVVVGPRYAVQAKWHRFRIAHGDSVLVGSHSLEHRHYIVHE